VTFICFLTFKATLFLVLLDDAVNECHSISLVERFGKAAGTLFHAGEVHVDDTYRTRMAGQPIGKAERIIFLILNTFVAKIRKDFEKTRI